MKTTLVLTLSLLLMKCDHIQIKDMKKEHVLHLDSCAEVQQLHSFLTLALRLNAINRVDQNTLIQLLESSRIAILGRQASPVN